VKLTGITQLDELINPLRKDWIVEFYGEPGIVLPIMHYTLAYRSSNDTVYVVLNIEFGGIDTLYLVKLCRIFNCRLDNILISRSFNLDTTISILEELLNVSNSLIILVYPYNYLPKDPVKYSEATRITGIINKISFSNQVLLFNTISKHGYYRPEGGSLHHHLVKVIVKLTTRGKLIVADLVKHPVKQPCRRMFSEKTIEHPVPKQIQKNIVDWLVSKKQLLVETVKQ